MTDEEYRNYLASSEFKDGTITIGGSRHLLLPAKWLSDVMIETEKIMGTSGSFAIFDTAARQTSMSEHIIDIMKNLTFEQRVGAFLHTLYLSGLGKFEILEMTKEPFMVKLKNKEPIFGDAYGGKADSPRCYLNSSIIPYFEGIAKMEGIDKPLKLTETQCVAMGAPHCEMIVEVDKGFE